MLSRGEHRIVTGRKWPVTCDDTTDTPFSLFLREREKESRICGVYWDNVQTTTGNPMAHRYVWDLGVTPCHRSSKAIFGRDSGLDGHVTGRRDRQFSARGKRNEVNFSCFGVGFKLCIGEGFEK